MAQLPADWEKLVLSLQERLRVLEEEKKASRVVDEKTRSLKQANKEIESLQQRIEILEQNKHNRDGGQRKKCARLVKQNSFTYLLAENVTALVGLREAIISPNWFIKITWLLLFIAGASATSYYVAKNCMEYYSNPVATKVTVSTPDTFFYPSFKLCIGGWIDPAKANATGLSMDAIKYTLGYMTNASLPELKQEPAILFDEFQRYFHRQNFTDLTEFFASLAYDVQLLALDKWMPSLVQHANNYDDQHLYMICDNCDFKYNVSKVYINEDGVCYQFKLRPETRKPRLVIRVQDNIVVVLPTTAVFPVKKSYWTMFVEADNGSMVPMRFESAVIATNSTNLLTVTRSTFSKFSTTEQPCTTNESPTSAECIQNCNNKFMQLLMSCRLFVMSETHKNVSDYCNFYQVTLEDVLARNATADMTAILASYSACYNTCIPQCTNTVHQLSMQNMEFDRDTLLIPANRLAAHLIIMDSSMRWRGILHYEEYPTYSFDSLVGNVGGTLGLFLGATVFTFVQLILTLVEYAIRGRRIEDDPKL